MIAPGERAAERADHKGQQEAQDNAPEAVPDGVPGGCVLPEGEEARTDTEGLGSRICWETSMAAACQMSKASATEAARWSRR